MLDIVVQPPAKTESKYLFRCSMRVRQARLERIGRRLRGMSPGERMQLEFGYHSVGFPIRHDDVWDGFYPLFFLTRLGRPALGLEYPEMRIRFTYPIARPLRDFFVRRALDHGITLEIDAEYRDIAYAGTTDGHVLAFGGGKDSRFILGLLRETVGEPTVITTGGPHSADIEGHLEVKPVYKTLTDRVMGSFMYGGTDVYFGCGLGESHLVTPWHRYYDLAAARPRNELTDLFAELGMATRVHSPTAVLPYNLIQWILSQRYPELYRHQTSTKPDAVNEKRLHVALLHLYRGLDWTANIDPAQFERQLVEFVSAQTERPTDFGSRDNREVINREMRSIIWRKRDDPALAAVRDRVPAEWDGAWIDYVHDYAEPHLDPAWLDVFTEYAPTVDDAPADVEVRRFPV